MLANERKDELPQMKQCLFGALSLGSVRERGGIPAEGTEGETPRAKRARQIFSRWRIGEEMGIVFCRVTRVASVCLDGSENLVGRPQLVVIQVVQ